MHRACAALAVMALLAIARTAAAESPSADLELLTRARAAISDVRAFERLNEDIVRLCREPVTGAYGDWREEFHADLERAHALAKALQRRLPGDLAEAPGDDRLKAFTEVEGQALQSRCLRWSTLLIQRESPVRADVAARFALLRDNEARLRAILANDAAWQEWRTSGAVH